MSEIVKPERLNDLKARVKAECLRRAYVGSVQSYGGTDYDYTLIPSYGVIISQEHRDKIASPLNAINSDTITLATGQNVVSENDMLALEAFTTTLEQCKAVSSNTGCKSSCTGLCLFDCATSCDDNCDSCTGCGNKCSDNCSESCDDECIYGCHFDCMGKCDNECSNSCVAVAAGA